MEFENIKFGWDAIGLVSRLIENWQPIQFSSEREAEDSLYEYLHNQFEHIQVTRQYGRGRATVDLVIGDRVMLELKHNFGTTSESQRLKGQLMEYKSWKMAIIVVLTGDTDMNLLKDLKTFVERELSGGTFFDDAVKGIQKKQSKRPSSNSFRTSYSR